MYKIDDADPIRVCCGEDEFYWLSERAERRLVWILSGILALATLPVLLLAFLM